MDNEIEPKKKLIDYFNDDGFRTNLESGFVGLVAIGIVIITKGFIGGFSWDLFLTLEPYASGIGVMIANSLIQNNMLVRGVYDEIDNNPDIKIELDEIDTLDKQITDYDYAEYFCENYNKNEFTRLQKQATEKQSRLYRYQISVKRSLGKNYDKIQIKYDNVLENGGTVKNYKPISTQDLLSFGNDGELKGADKINFKVIKAQQNKLIRSNAVLFLASGLLAGLPLVQGNTAETFGFLAIWIPALIIKAFRTYAKSRRVTKTTYYKSLQYKKNVLTLCVDNHKHYTPPVKETFEKDSVVKVELIE